MIKLEKYKAEFEKEYWETVDKKIPRVTQTLIICSCLNFLPSDFFDYGPPSFYKIVMAPFEKIKRAQAYIRSSAMEKMKKECIDPLSQNKSNLNNLYIQIYDAFDRVADSQKNKTSMRVRLVEAADVTVCPYCNRDYINCRAESVSGAQLDHFFNRALYPIFAVSLYNLVPVCGNCNRIKSAQPVEFASPFDETIDWEKEIWFEYDAKSLSNLKINIKTTNTGINNNIKSMRIKEAYQIHENEILELQEKQKAYEKSQIEEFQKVLKNNSISDDDVKQIIFGSELTMQDMRKKPLGKLYQDMYKELGIY